MKRLAAVVCSAALALAACSPTLRSAPTTPSPLGSGSAATTVAGTPPVSSASRQSGAAPPKPATVVRNVSPRPGSDDGLIVLTRRVCGTSASWVSQANANHIAGPAYVVLDSAKLVIDCSLPAIAPAAQPAPAAVPATSTKPQPAVAASAKTTAGWVRPLGGSWCFQPNGSREFGTQRPGHLHGGIDLGSQVGAYYGSPIYAIHAGTAHWGYQAGGAGIYVWVDHGDGTSSWYFHMSRRGVGDGVHVSAGTLIGYVGATGDAVGAHLHLEVHVNGTRVDPVKFLAARGIRIGC